MVFRLSAAPSMPNSRPLQQSGEHFIAATTALVADLPWTT